MAKLVVVVCRFARAGEADVVVATWPNVPWAALEVALLLLVVPLPILTYPFAKTTWLALDLWLRPMRRVELEGHGENETGGNQAGG